MKTSAMLAAALLLGLGVRYSPDPPGSESRWLADLGAATTLASETGKPMLAVFR